MKTPPKRRIAGSEILKPMASSRSASGTTTLTRMGSRPRAWSFWIIESSLSASTSQWMLVKPAFAIIWQACAVASNSSASVGSGTACQIRLAAVSRKTPVNLPSGFLSTGTTCRHGSLRGYSCKLDGFGVDCANHCGFTVEHNWVDWCGCIQICQLWAYVFL